MSVIFDALRRGPRRPHEPRRPGEPAHSSSVRVPTGLGLGHTQTPPSRPRRTQSAGVLAVLLVALGIGAAWWFLMRSPDAPPRTATTPAPARKAVAPPSPPVETSASVPTTDSPPASQRDQGAAVPDSLASARTAASAARSASLARTTASSREGEFEQAVRYHTSGDLDQASRHYLAAIAADGRLLEARNNLGLLYRSRGQATDAIDQFKQALAIDPRYVAARNHLAVTLIDAGRAADARAELAAGLAIDPRDPDLQVNMALVEKSDGHPERALELLLDVLGNRPTHAAAHYNLAVIYDERGSAALAYQHYSSFVKYAGTEYASIVPDVRRRAEALAALAGLTK